MPELAGKLLSTALKHGSIYAFDPAAGEGEGFTRYYLDQNCLRDIEIADGGRTVYLLTDSQGGLQTDEGEGAQGLENPGAILAYTAGGARARMRRRRIQMRRQPERLLRMTRATAPRRRTGPAISPPRTRRPPHSKPTTTRPLAAPAPDGGEQQPALN